jgi:hypothetical protein
MKYFYFFLFLITFPACGSLNYQYGTTEINRCPSCKKCEFVLENYHETTQVIRFDNRKIELAPGKRKVVFIDLDSTQVANKGYTVVELEYAALIEPIKLYPGIGYDLRPWMSHIRDVKP